MAGTLTAPIRQSGMDTDSLLLSVSLAEEMAAEQLTERFDIYDQGRRLVLSMSGWISRMHSGILPAYLAWCIIGMIILLFVLVKL